MTTSSRLNPIRLKILTSSISSSILKAIKKKIPILSLEVTLKLQYIRRRLRTLSHLSRVFVQRWRDRELVLPEISYLLSTS